MSVQGQRLCALCGPVMLVLLIVGFWVIAGFVPPPLPTRPIAETVAWFEADAFSIRLGLLLTTLAAAFYGPWVAAISVQLRRIEGQHTPYTYAQLALGAVFILEVLVPPMIWQAAVYRPADDPMITQRLNDLAWLMFVGVAATALLQALVIGVAIVRDTRELPVFPRWVGYFNLWLVLLYVPGSLCVFFKEGPLAWSGWLAWWVPVTAFAAWLLVMGLVVALVCVPRQLEEERRSPQPA